MSLLPENLPLIAAVLLIFASFFTAALTARMGIGGGLVLLAVMSGLLPPMAVIPVHGIAQMGANFSRSVLQFKSINWPIIGWFSAGALVGIALAGQVVIALPDWAIRSGVGTFILFTVWGPKPGAFFIGKQSFLLTGGVSSFLTMFFGATGPFVASMLAATSLNRMQISASHATCMVVQHGFKIITFGFLGFAFAQWVPLLAAIILSGSVGTAVGTSMLKKASEHNFKTGINVVLTLIAVYLLAISFLSAIRTN